jgi:hypothetical protein
MGSQGYVKLGVIPSPVTHHSSRCVSYSTVVSSQSVSSQSAVRPVTDSAPAGCNNDSGPAKPDAPVLFDKQESSAAAPPWRIAGKRGILPKTAPKWEFTLKIAANSLFDHTLDVSPYFSILCMKIGGAGGWA